MLSDIKGLAGAGIIGVAPYRFLDSPAGAPMACTVPGALTFVVSEARLDASALPPTLDAIQSGAVLSSSDAKTLTVQTVTSDATAPASSSALPKKSFIAADANAYVAQLENGKLTIRVASCGYGFRGNDGQLKPDSSFAWFSNCKFYFTNDGQFPQPAPETPARPSVSQQPIVFSTNGQGQVCNFVTTPDRMPANRAAPVQPVVAPTNTDELGRIASLSCGACLASGPMPEAFCHVGIANAFPDTACTQYPQMDDQFLLANADPVAMRAIAVGESGLGLRGTDGSGDPACQIGFGASQSACNAATKTEANLQSDANSFCSAGDIGGNYNPTTSNPYACGLGVMQCTDWPGAIDACGGANYNPFNPADSACCGCTNSVTTALWRARCCWIFVQATTTSIPRCPMRISTGMWPCWAPMPITTAPARSMPTNRSWRNTTRAMTAASPKKSSASMATTMAPISCAATTTASACVAAAAPTAAAKTRNF